MIYLLTVSFALGIIFQNFFNFSVWSNISTLVLITCTALIFARKNIKLVKIILCVALMVFLGVIRLSLFDQGVDPSFTKLVDQKILVEGRVVAEPDERDLNTRYVFKPNESDTKILLVADRYLPIEYGDSISVSGVLKYPKNFITDSGVEFDYISYLKKDGINFLIYRPTIDIKSKNSKNIVGSLYRTKNFFAAKLKAVIPEPNASLVNGLIFGAKQSLGEKLLADFQKVGLIHIVVLSGYNITIIGAAIFYLFSKLNKRNLSFIISIIFMITFSIMVGLGATVLRACIMAIISLIALYLGRPKEALHFLFVAGVLMIIWNPLTLLYDPSFHLSFMATLGLILFSEPVISKLNFVTKKFGLREIVASTLAVQIFLMPILIKISGQISIVSFFINPLVLPLVPITMLAGAATSFVGLFSTLLSWPFGILAYLSAELILRLTIFAADLPLSSILIENIPTWLIIVWYGVYGLVYFKLNASKFEATFAQFKLAKKSST